MANEYLDPGVYGQFSIQTSVSIEGGLVTWTSMVPSDRERIIATVREHAETYRKLGYGVVLEISPDSADMDLRIRFKNQAHVRPADIEILKGSMAATEVKAGWGGGS